MNTALSSPDLAPAVVPDTPAVKSAVIIHADPAPRDAPPAWLTHGQVPSLDGLRAISILLVVIAHAAPTDGFPLPGLRTPITRLGGVGVNIFFVISGFLITLLLLREQARTGTVSLKAFFVRRAFRLLPAYAAFLVGLALLCAFGLERLRGVDWAVALTYTANYYPDRSWPISHLWSLSVEENFYLVWPLLFFLWPGRAGLFAAGYIVLAPCVRLLTWLTCRDSLPDAFAAFGHFDSIAIGCGLALMAHHPRLRGWVLEPLARRPLRVAAVLAVGLVASAVLLPPASLSYALCFRTVSAACYAGLAWLAVSHPAAGLGRWLNAPPAVWLGRLSYSFYLWQQPFLWQHGTWWGCRWPVNVVLAFALAVASFYLIEAPLLRLRERRGWGKA